MAIKSSKTIFITSPKGGTGKTNVLLNLSFSFARMNKKVLLIDLDLYSSTINFILNLETKYDIANLVSDISNGGFNDLNKYIYSYNNNIDILSAPKDPRDVSKIDSKYIDIILYKVKTIYDVILIDSNSTLELINLSTMEQSDLTLYIINNEPLSIKNMKSIVSIFEESDKKNYSIILNNSVSKYHSYYTNYDLNFILGKVINYTIPSNLFDKNINKSIISGKFSSLNKPNKIYDKLALSLLKEVKNEETN